MTHEKKYEYDTNIKIVKYIHINEGRFLHNRIKQKRIGKFPNHLH